MTWSDLYLGCFLVGFTLSVLSFLAGAVHIHLPFKLHLPFHGGHASGGHFSGGHGHAAHVGGHASAHAGSHGGGAGAKGGMRGGQIPWFNATTAMAFLAWFGGVGYILTTHSRLMATASLSFATLAGLFAAWLVFRFMTRLMRDSQGEMYDWDYRLEGVVGTVSMPIREKGTGEVIFERDGARRSVSARCESGLPIVKDREVVIERYEDGIAYVRPWEEFTK
jgi:membrane protein implicated in regulation of membrane protease activity